jgi:hypothetical protein
MQEQPTSPGKDKYKVKNWQQYTASLCKRGSLTLWIEDSVFRSWQEVNPAKKVVGEQLYPDSVIGCCLVLGMQYHQKLRQTTGFVASLLALLGKSAYAVPDYTTLCRRQACLPVELSQRWQQGEKLAVGIDSTGLKVYGEGEWKVRKHGVSKRRTWRKLHIGLDLATQEIISVELTTNSEDDAAVAERMLKGKTTQMKSFTGDGAYDDFNFRQVLGGQVQQIIPPPKDAVIHPVSERKPAKAFLQQRNEAVAFIEGHSRKEWKVQQGYHQRSRNEVAMFRYKTSFTHQLNARKIDQQQTEAKIKCKILNTYRRVGMPLAYKVA